MYQHLQNRSGTAVDDLVRLRESAYATEMLVAALVELDLFTRLTAEPADLPTLCRDLNIHERPADVMVTLFKAWGLLEQQGERLVPTDIARRHLLPAAPASLFEYLGSLRSRPGVQDMIGVLRRGHSQVWEAKQENDKKLWTEMMERSNFAEFYTAFMNSRGSVLAPSLAAEFDCSGFRRLLDVAGGSGIYATHLVRRHPNLTAAVLEKPPVDQVARTMLEREGMRDRIAVHAADMFSDDYPTGYDLHLYSHILHDWTLAQCEVLVRKSFAALTPGGTIGVYSAHLNADKSGPAPVAEYSVLMMYLYQGRCYSVLEMQRLLETAGFVDVAVTPSICHRSLITGRKPG